MATTYYVRKTGSDGAAGTSPATAWATIGKALGAAGITYGDTVYIGAGTYREAVDVALADGSRQEVTNTASGNPVIAGGFVPGDVGFTIEGTGIPAGATIVSVVNGVSATISAAPTTTETACPFYVRDPAQNVETFVIGDVDGVMTGDAGEVRWTNHVTNDTTIPVAQTCDLNGRSYLTFRRINIVGHSNTSTIAAVDLDQSGGHSSTHITFTDCSIRGLVWGGGFPVFAGINTAWLFDRCVMVAVGEVFEGAATRKSTLDWDVGVVFKNSLLVALAASPTIAFLDGSGSSGGRPGGVQFLNCTIVGGAIGCDTRWATTIPILVTNCQIIGTYVNATTSGQIVEDYNQFIDARAANNVSAGAHSVIYGAPLFSLGDETVWGAAIRAFGVPMAGSPALRFGGSSPQALDIVGAPRVAAFAAAGAYERGNTFVKETGTVRTGSNAISITGPGYQDFHLRVNPVSTTVTVYVRWDATYAGTKPKLQVLRGTEAGVADATSLAVGGSGSWEQLSLNFTPTAAGIVTIRFLSSDTNGGGKMFVDDLLSIP